MKRAVRMVAVLGVIATLCIGCGRAEKPTLEEAPPKTEAVTQTKDSRARQWEPETATQPKAHDPHDGRDHSGHNH